MRRTRAGAWERLHPMTHCARHIRETNVFKMADRWGDEEEIVTISSSPNSEAFQDQGDSVDVKSEPSSPDGEALRLHIVTQGADSDAQDEDASEPCVVKEHRRYAHSAAEQKRRDAIRKGYDDLQTIVPLCHQNQQSQGISGSQKPSKAVVLQKTIEYIHYLQQQKKKQEEEVEALRREAMALKIMKTNYEQIAKANQNQPVQGQKYVTDQTKFSVFKHMMDTQFLSFDATVNVTSFESLSACIFSWLEEYCKPQVLREIVISALQTLNQQGHLQS